MNILLTGSSGWLGRHLSPMLAAAGHSVVGLDAAPGRHTGVVGSVVERPLLETLFASRRFDAVVHAAALHKPDIARYPGRAFVDVNVTGTLHLLELASASGIGRFVMTSTTSLMISQQIREETGEAAAWLDESVGPLEPRNIYGVTKLAAEGLCRLHWLKHGLPCIVLRTSRFFPEEDDTHRELSGPNLKANEFLHRRLTVEDAARAHVAALDRAPGIGFGVYVVSAATPFTRDQAGELKRSAPAAIKRAFPDAEVLYAGRGWRLPASIGRVYDAARAERELGFRCSTTFGTILDSLRDGAALPFCHDPDFVSPSASAGAGSTPPK